MSDKSSLDRARRVADDEFYTRLPDVTEELSHYAPTLFAGKTVYLPCDTDESAFWLYFDDLFDELGLKRLVATAFSKDGTAYQWERRKGLSTARTPLKQNGDFRSPECLALLGEADIVVTNPPFSLFRKFLRVLMEHDKAFIVLGNKNAIGYKETLAWMRDGRVWLGANACTNLHFYRPDDAPAWDRVELCFATARPRKVVKLGLTRWFTNIPHTRDKPTFIPTAVYKGNEDKYPRFDNLPDAINVDKVKDIPGDYPGVMGVPITFMDKFNPAQYELHGFVRDIAKDASGRNGAWVHGKEKYARVAIRRKDGPAPEQFELLGLIGDLSKAAGGRNGAWVHGKKKYDRLAIKRRKDHE